jgi:hypothetical protein
MLSYKLHGVPSDCNLIVNLPCLYIVCELLRLTVCVSVMMQTSTCGGSSAEYVTNQQHPVVNLYYQIQADRSYDCPILTSELPSVMPKHSKLIDEVASLAAVAAGPNTLNVLNATVASAKHWTAISRRGSLAAELVRQSGLVSQSKPGRPLGVGGSDANDSSASSLIFSQTAEKEIGPHKSMLSRLRNGVRLPERKSLLVDGNGVPHFASIDTTAMQP